MIEDWHTHNSLCRHAKGKLKDYVKSALNKELATIGFSDHFPYEFYDLGEIPQEEYGMTLQEVDSYISTTIELREEFKKEIAIKLGFELDYMEEKEYLLNEHLDPYKKNLDYLLGSIHILEPKEGKWCLDDNRYLKEYEFYGIDEVYFQYFNKMERMLNSKNFDFDILSHFDLPKKFNKHPINIERITKKAIELLELVKKKDKVVEINTGGFRKEVGEQYPSEKYIKVMYDLDIPILLSSDSHDPNEIGYRFDEIIKMVRKIGYSELAHFNRRERTFIKI